MRSALLLILTMSACAESTFGTWKVNLAKSIFIGEIQLKTFSLRIEPHAKGEVFTVDTVAVGGRASTFSSILYFDGKARPFRDSTCLGTQASDRLDSETVAIVRECAGGQVRLIRRMGQRGVLILEIFERHTDGRRSERSLVMEKE